MDNNKHTILVVDDEPLVLNFCALALTTSGFNVLTAERGSIALEICRKARAENNSIDLALLDVVMPGMSCRELAECLVGLGIPTVVLMSGYPAEELLSGLGHELPPHHRFIMKPFTPSVLLQIVRQILT